MTPIRKPLRSLLALLLSLVAATAAAEPDPALVAAVAGEHRDPANVARDPWRHPLETLDFFGLAPAMTVVEITPGGGWYTEILAAALAGEGKLYAAGFPVSAGNAPGWMQQMHDAFLAMLAAKPAIYGHVTVTELGGSADAAIAPAGSADLVLTFRNVHNWMKAGTADAVFAAMHQALKSGGTLGVVEHRAPAGTSEERMIESGYVTEAKVKTLAAAAGFEFVAASEVNANPADTADHPAGVWTLPPRLRLGEQDRDKYLAIGESDRMTLKFRKP